MRININADSKRSSAAVTEGRGKEAMAVSKESSLRNALRKVERAGTSALLAGALVAYSSINSEAKGVNPSTIMQKKTCVVQAIGMADINLTWPHMGKKAWTILDDSNSLTNSIESVLVYNGKTTAIYNAFDFNGKLIIRPGSIFDIGGGTPLYYLGVFDIAMSKAQISTYAKESAVGMVERKPANLMYGWPSQQSSHTIQECKASLVAMPGLELNYPVSSNVQIPSNIIFSLVNIPKSRRSTSQSGRGPGSARSSSPSTLKEYQQQVYAQPASGSAALRTDSYRIKLPSESL
jgi:hypothetical protein